MFDPSELEGYGEGGHEAHAAEIYSYHGGDFTPQLVALYLVAGGAVLWGLKQYGFRFNFGVAAGR
jgi:hypothetical protein